MTDDRTEDWWQIAKDDGEAPMTIGPRPELAAELWAESGVTLFYMYKSDRFLEWASLKMAVSSSSIDEVRNVAEQQALSEANVEFTDQVGTDFDHHAFQFLIRVNGEDHWCVIAQETVEDFFALAGDSGHAEAWQAFQTGWPLIQLATREAIRNVSVGKDGRIIIAMRELNAARDNSTRHGDTSPVMARAYDPAPAPTHRVRFTGARENWPSARDALYATGRIRLLEMNHQNGVFEVLITTKGPLNRASVHRALRSAGFEILPRSSGGEEQQGPGRV